MDGHEELTIRANGLDFFAVAAGPHDGPLVLLLHGFPEGWYGWRAQLGALAAAGYRVVAPDGRGYGRSAKPTGARAYGLDHLAGDVVGIIAALGRDQAALVEHDWGAIVAWTVAARHPSWVTRLAILNVPHPATLGAFLRAHPSQWLRSWYIAFFQLPWLPEATLRANDWATLARSLTGTSRPGTFTDADLARYRATWAAPGALTAMINWYRALVRFGRTSATPRVAVPTLILWGSHDQFLDRRLATASLDWCADGRLIELDASHWVQHEEAARVNAELAAWLGA
jgi:pimeloyl-ACP methyl ester carboxylesterase